MGEERVEERDPMVLTAERALEEMRAAKLTTGYGPYYPWIAHANALEAALRDRDRRIGELEAALARARVESTRKGLASLREFVDRDAWVWAYPTSYDLPVIERACRTFDVKCPWKWTKTMCGRTLWSLACSVDPSMEKIESAANPTEHDALSDAKEQARWYAKYLSAIEKRP